MSHQIITDRKKSPASLTGEIQAKINRCHEAGGGTVAFAPGEYRCGMLTLKSGVALQLESGAVLKSSNDPALFPEICKKPYNELPGHIRAFLYAEDAENVVICGAGTIDGGFPAPLALPDAKKCFFRPELLFFRNCNHVSIEQVTLKNSGFWTVHLMRCVTVRLYGLRIRNHLERINTDGIDPDGCRDVIISDCDIRTGDDCIVLKSSEGDPCENIMISNCLLRTAHGALKLGTECLGHIRNVTIQNCVIPAVKGRKIKNPGIGIFMKDGTLYENISFSNILMEGRENIALYIENRPRYHPSGKPGAVRNIRFDNLLFRGSGRVLIQGDPDGPIDGLSLTNCRFEITGHEMASNRPVGSGRTDHAPDSPHYLSIASHLILAHVTRSTLHNITVTENRKPGAPDRGVLALDHVTQTDISNLNTQIDCGTYPKIRSEESIKENA